MNLRKIRVYKETKSSSKPMTHIEWALNYLDFALAHIRDFEKTVSEDEDEEIKRAESRITEAYELLEKHA